MKIGFFRITVGTDYVRDVDVFVTNSAVVIIDDGARNRIVEFDRDYFDSMVREAINTGLVKL